MKSVSFNKDWLFCLGNQWKESEAEPVCLPHSVQLTPENSSGCRNYQGDCMYRKHFFVPDAYREKRVVLEFEGAMGVSMLFLNGRKVKEHYCGYTPLVADVSDYLIYGEENQIEMTLDNTDNGEVPPGKPQADLDFSYDGGLYRDSRLIVTDRLYISNPLLENEVAGGGVFFWSSDVTEEHALAHARIHIKNDYDVQRDCLLQVSLIDENGSTVGSFRKSCTVESHGAVYQEGTIAVENPDLWSPETPSLYTLCCQLLCDGQAVYTQNISVGIRTFVFTLHDGVVFNGKSRRFNGANYHQTWPIVGNAVPNSMLRRDIKLIKGMGMDNIRSHYPFSSAFVEACNRLGMTLIVSNIGWQFCQPGIFLERTLENIRNIVRWQRNNPCILMWEPILNESAMSYDVQLNFHNAVHEEYPYGPCYTASDYGPTDVAYKEYDPGMLGSWEEEYGLIERSVEKEQPLWVREYGDAPDDYYNQNTVWRCRRAWGDGAMVGSVDRMLGRFEKFNDCHMYLDICNDPKYCGYGIWPAIAHNRGYHINPCWGGHLDLFRVPKFSYYFMQSQMDREQAGDVLYLASWWAETSPNDVTVYSNAERVQLYWNDELIGEQTPDDVAVKHPPFTFLDVRRRFKCRERSVLTAKAYVGEQLVAQQSVKAPGVVTHMTLEAEFLGESLVADGADLIAVRCYMRDDDENIVPLTGDIHPVLFDVTGAGTIVGDSSIGANPVLPEAGIATILVRSTQNPGDITIHAKMFWEQAFCRAIRPCELTIQSVADQNA